MYKRQAFNVIPQEAKFGGTIRTFDLNVRKLVIERIEKIAHGIAEAMGCKAEVKIVRVTPAVVNNVVITEKVQTTARQTLSNANLDTSGYLTMGAEDMAFMQEKVDGCYFFIGSSNKDKNLDYSHHHPKFDFDEQALVNGVALMASAAADLLK